jgi:uncharacterized protein
LILAAGVCVLLMTARENRNLYQNKSIIEKGETIAAIDTTTTKLTSLQKSALQKMEDFKTRNEPATKVKSMQESIDQVTGSYASVYDYRTNDYIDSLARFIYLSLWDVLIFMLLGIAFFKLGILTGTAPIKVYAWMCVAGLTIGLALSWVLIKHRIDHNFNGFTITKNIPFSFHELSRTPRALGIFGLIMLLYKSNWISGIFSMLRPVGQMAFTNYLMQSLICGLQRYETYLVVLYIWIFQIIFSNIWMRYFLFGPFEWAWRSLTYWQRQPFVRRAEATIELLDVPEKNPKQAL